MLILNNYLVFVHVELVMDDTTSRPISQKHSSSMVILYEIVDYCWSAILYEQHSI